jgi:hypothetical protein
VKIAILKRDGADMQKTLMISLSSILFVAPMMAGDVYAGLLTTQQCLALKERMECPIKQLDKITPENPLMIYQENENKLYVLDVSSIDKKDLKSIGFRNGVYIFGHLRGDGMTFVVRKVSPPRPLEDVKNQAFIEGWARPSGAG